MLGQRKPGMLLARSGSCNYRLSPLLQNSPSIITHKLHSPGFRSGHVNARTQFFPSPTALYSSSNNYPSWNPVDVVKREQGLQSNKLPAPVREAVGDAIEELRFRVTVGDVASRAGVKVSEADEALKALAYDAAATLEVSEQGDVVYEFPRDFQATLQRKSVLIRARPVLKAAQSAAAYLVRVAFGTALLFSVALVWFAIAVLLTSRDNDDRGNRGGGGHFNRYYGGLNGGGYGARVFFDLTDLFIYLDPNWGRTSQQRLQSGAQLTFLEAIFSFVFGDGDPNVDFDTARWSSLGQMIAERGGVVTAEEMAPYLDPGQPQSQGGYADESFVLPALIRFGGEAVVDEEGTGALLYRFPSLQTSAVTRERVGRRDEPQEVNPYVEEGVAQEQTWDFTAASPGQLMGVLALGGFNVFGVATLAAMLADPVARYTLAYQGLGFVVGLMPWLQAYAAAFFLIPGVRWLINTQRNAAIDERNDARSRAARVLHSGANWLKQKLSLARREGKQRTIRRGEAIFTTGKEAGQQLDEAAAKDWDSKFQSRSDAAKPTDSARAGQVPQQKQASSSSPSTSTREFLYPVQRDGLYGGGGRQGGDVGSRPDLQKQQQKPPSGSKRHFDGRWY